MRTHKYNVERRMQNENNYSDWSYWNQRRDKLKQNKQPETLDPSWYTDNIYSNQSLDLDGDGVPDYIKYDHFFLHGPGFNGGSKPKNNNGNKLQRHHSDPHSYADFDDDVFCVQVSGKPKTPTRDYKYPKSRSCCFGGGYEPTSKPTSVMPKSSSFSTARANANFAKIRAIKKTYDTNRFMDTPQRKIACSCMRQSRVGGVGFDVSRNDGGACRDIDDGCVVMEDLDECDDQDDFCYTRNCDRYSRNCAIGGKRIYHIDTHPGRRTNKMCGVRSKADYIRNEWLDRHKNIRKHGDKNGNMLFDDDVAEACEESLPRRRDSCFTEDYLLLDDNDLSNVYEYNQFHRNFNQNNCNRRRSSYELDQFTNDPHSNLFMFGNNDFIPPPTQQQRFNLSTPKSIIKNKSMLEVKPPSRYDDTSSDSTDLELDDFNFDFEKYWENLDKTNSLLNIDDLQNNNHRSNFNNFSGRTLSKHGKIKNVNISRYNNGTLIDHNTPHMHHSHLHQHYHHHHNSNNDNNNERTNDRFYIDNAAAAAAEAAAAAAVNQSHFNANNIMGCGGGCIGYVDNDFNQTTSATPLASPFHRLSRKVHPERSIFNNFYAQPIIPPPSLPPPLHHHIPPPPSIVEHHPQHQQPSSSSLYNNNALSLINNIFSIYKPKKYSPLNCHTQQIGLKPEPCKKMNVPSTIRPLGAPQNEFMTSLKRPLIVTPSSGVEQPLFKIIPEKTGLKISPLYQFDFDGNDNKYELKSTARPLLFPH